MSRTTLTLDREEAHALRCAIEPRLAILIKDVRIFARHVSRPQGQAGGRASGEHLARLGRILLALEEADR